MTEQVEPVIAFLDEMKALFNKHSNVFIAADGRLAVQDYEGLRPYIKTYCKRT